MKYLVRIFVILPLALVINTTDTFLFVLREDNLQVANRDYVSKIFNKLWKWGKYD